MDDSPEIVLAWTAGSGSSGTLTARIGDDVLAADRLDILKPKHRDEFVARVCKDRPGIDGAALSAELLKLAGDAAAKIQADETPDVSGAPLLEAAHLARPELFHTPHVSGLAVPSVRIVGGVPVGRWELLLRWHSDGRREKRDLESALELPGGGLLWLWPRPSDPTPSSRAGWSAAGRAAWLDGAAAPDPGDVFKRLTERFAYFVELPHETRIGAVATLALWSLLTYCYPAWSAIPYLAIGGPLGSGKSTLFGVLARLVFRPLASSNMTAPTLFRSLHELGGSLLLDEAERLREQTPDAAELRSILLSGYKRGSPAMRLEKDGERFVRVEFDVFGPKCFAAIASPPEALASRAIRIAMLRAAPDSPKPRRRIDANPAIWSDLRDDLHALALEHGRTWLDLADRADVVPAALAGRDFELWQPLLALAAWLEERGAQGLLKLMQDYAAEATEAGRDDSAPDADELLLRVLARHVLAGSHGTLKAADVLREAREADPAEFGSERAARWKPRSVANVLRRYGFAPKKGRGNTGRTYSGATLPQLRRVERSYGFDLGLPTEPA